MAVSTLKIEKQIYGIYLFRSPYCWRDRRYVLYQRDKNTGRLLMHTLSYSVCYHEHVMLLDVSIPYS